MSVNDLAKIIDIIDNNSKMIGEFTNITKGILAKDPKALENDLAQNLIKNHFGETMYDKIQKIYQELIGT